MRFRRILLLCALLLTIRSSFGERSIPTAATGSETTADFLPELTRLFFPADDPPTETVRRQLIPGGQNIGVAMNCAGVVVVGTSDPTGARSPAQQAGLHAGDVITQVNGRDVTGAEAFSEMIASDAPAELTVQHDADIRHVTLTPVFDSARDQWQIGAWVRDSVAGIGTLTFIDPESGRFGALGHAIQDADTLITLPVSEGGIYESSITGILPGASGAPGEIMGAFYEQNAPLGDVSSNTPYGIYGNYTAETDAAALPAGNRHEIHTGDAQILTTLSDGEPQAYDVKIVRLYPQEKPAIRSMIVQVTDEELLSQTGGIVQGMSGSPILQDGKLVGAVTHVFLNDPTMGYGVYIDWMLEESAA